MERRKTPNFDEQVSKRSHLKPDTYHPKTPDEGLSPFANLVVKNAKITIEFSYKDGHSGSNDFTNYKNLSEFLKRNPNISEFFKNK